MDITYGSHSVLDTKCELAVFCVFHDLGKSSLVRAIDRITENRLTHSAADENFSGKKGQSLLFDTRDEMPAKRILLLGIGDKSALDAATYRNMSARAIRVAMARGAKRVAIEVIRHRNAETAFQLAAEGIGLGDYSFDKYKKRDAGTRAVASVTLHSSGKSNSKRTKAARAGIRRGKIVGAAIAKARDLVNEPAAFMTPKQVAAEAKELAKHKSLTLRVYSAAECKALGMNMFLAVGQGSKQQPQMIHLRYKPTKKAKRRIALVGKGVTFDSGGYSLKPSSAMEDMKIDMAGSAAVISAMGAIAQIAPPVEVHAVAACCENLVSGNAYKLGDVLRAMDGTTVEINNTDAEGRLTLGDAITFVRTKIKPDEILDFATLTGACMVALGPTIAGVMSTNEPMVKRWFDAASQTGEAMWRLPLAPELKSQLKSNIADLRNTGERYGGAITAGLFLKHFAKDTPWLHVDLAGPASSTKTAGAVCRGGTGFAVATIVAFVCQST